MAITKAEWVFDALPPSGARRGGDAAEHVFKHDLDTFVREVVQNANDQRVGNPRLDFTLESLTGADLKAFLDHLDLTALRPHLQAASSPRSGHRLLETLRFLDEKRRIVILRIEDRETHGLTGAEDSTDSHFRALCKDTLFSHKRSDSAGGSFGLGKSVLWAFSGLSTVVFNSVPRECPPGFKAPRFIARTELSSHEIAGTEFSGSGWFGQRVSRATGDRAESLWGLTAATVARELRLSREHTGSGTSILIVGFREPAAEIEESVEQVERRILLAANTWFWPAMCLDGRRLEVTTGGRPAIEPIHVEEVHPFVECYQSRRTQRAALENPGDIVVREIPFSIPATRAGAPAVNAEVRLMVRLAPDDASDALLGHVAQFRGAGMVVKYLDKRSLASVGRPFHAALACGEARQPEAPTHSDRAVEAFLRRAEPPGHDDWDSTDALKEIYQRGYARALAELKDRVSVALRELLVPRADLGTRGPERLMKRFPFGARGQPGGAPTSFLFSKLKGRLEHGVWRFEGGVEPSSAGGRWAARIKLSEVGDDGQQVSDVGIAALSAEQAKLRIEAGVAYLEVPRGVERITFSGVSVVVASGDRASVLDLAVTGTREAKG